MRSLLLCVLAVGCGTTSPDSFLIETTDCALVNNFQINNQPSQWNDCRVYWQGTATEVLTIELTIPGSSGSFSAPDLRWVRASMLVRGGHLDATLQSSGHPMGELPTAVPADELALDLLITNCGNVGGGTLDGPFSVDTMADVGDRSVSFSMSFTGQCTAEGSILKNFSGGFILTAAAKAGSTATGDPATVVGPLP